MSKTRKPKPMKFRQSLFWDVDPKTIDPKKHARYIIERIMNLGNDHEVHWMAHYYQTKLLKDVAMHSKALDPKSRVLWSLIWK